MELSNHESREKYTLTPPSPLAFFQMVQMASVKKNLSFMYQCEILKFLKQIKARVQLDSYLT